EIHMQFRPAAPSLTCDLDECDAPGQSRYGNGGGRDRSHSGEGGETSPESGHVTLEVEDKLAFPIEECAPACKREAGRVIVIPHHGERIIVHETGIRRRNGSNE